MALQDILDDPRFQAAPFEKRVHLLGQFGASPEFIRQYSLKVLPGASEAQGPPKPPSFLRGARDALGGLLGAPDLSGGVLGRLQGLGEGLGPRAVVEGQAAQLKKAAAAPTGTEAAGHAAAGILPILGPAAAQAGESFGRGDVGGGTVQTAALLGPLLAGPLVRALRGEPPAAEATFDEIGAPEDVNLIKGPTATQNAIARASKGVEATAWLQRGLHGWGIRHGMQLLRKVIGTGPSEGAVGKALTNAQKAYGAEPGGVDVGPVGAAGTAKQAAAVQKGMPTRQFGPLSPEEEAQIEAAFEGKPPGEMSQGEMTSVVRGASRPPRGLSGDAVENPTPKQVEKAMGGGEGEEPTETTVDNLVKTHGLPKEKAVETAAKIAMKQAEKAQELRSALEGGPPKFSPEWNAARDAAGGGKPPGGTPSEGGGSAPASPSAAAGPPPPPADIPSSAAYWVTRGGAKAQRAALDAAAERAQPTPGRPPSGPPPAPPGAAAAGAPAPPSLQALTAPLEEMLGGSAPAAGAPKKLFATVPEGAATDPAAIEQYLRQRLIADPSAIDVVKAELKGAPKGPYRDVLQRLVDEHVGDFHVHEVPGASGGSH